MRRSCLTGAASEFSAYVRAPKTALICKATKQRTKYVGPSKLQETMLYDIAFKEPVTVFSSASITQTRKKAWAPSVATGGPVSVDQISKT